MPLKVFLQKYKHTINVFIIVLISIFCFAWVANDTLGEAWGLGSREIIHDEYSILTESISGAQDIKQTIMLEKNKRLYGVNVDLHTYNSVVFGTIYVDLLDKDGNFLTGSSDDMTTIKDNTFKRFIFDEMQVSGQDQQYILHIHTSPQTENDKLALWKSEDAKQGFDLYESSKKADGTIALQYITNYVGKNIYLAFFAVALFLTIFLVLLYWLLFVKKAKPQTIFAVFAVFVGITFCFYTPQRGAPDEYVHIATSYYNANNILGIKDSFSQDNGTLLMRKCDATSLIATNNYNVFELQETYEGLFEKAVDKDIFVPVKAKKAEIFPPLYFAQTLGITIARLLGLGYIPMLLLGRIFNLALYVVLVYFAIKIIPFFKTPISLIALTPIPLQLAGSFSYDTLVIGLCFLFIAVCFDYAYIKDILTRKNLIALAVLAAFIAPSKTLYITVIGFCFIIPFKKWGGNKKALLSTFLIVCVAVFTWGIYNSGFIKEAAIDFRGASEFQQEKEQLKSEQSRQESPEVILHTQSKAFVADSTPVNSFSDSSADSSSDSYTNSSSDSSVQNPSGKIDNAQNNLDSAPDTSALPPDTFPNGDSIYCYSFGYMITHIPQSVKIFINTLQENLPLYMQGLFGGILGEIIISPVIINWLYVFAVMIILILSLVEKQTEPLEYKGLAKLWGLAIALATCGLIVLACMTWTPINYTTIFGIQGRYLLPVFPFILLFFTNRNITCKKSISSYLIFAMAVVDILILLDGFTIMAVNTKFI